MEKKVTFKSKYMDLSQTIPSANLFKKLSCKVLKSLTIITTSHVYKHKEQHRAKLLMETLRLIARVFFNKDFTLQRPFHNKR